MGLEKHIMKAMDEHKAKVAGPHFIFSAENPKFKDKVQLNLNHGDVLSHLKHAGYDAHEMQGHYGMPEKSIIVYGVNQNHAEKLHDMASRLGQDSSIYSTGKEHEMRFHHGPDAGKKVTGSGTVWHKQKPNDLFTSLPGDSGHFTHNFNFEKSEDERMNLVHFSNRGDLEQIDPKFKSKGVDAHAKGRDTEHKHSFFYREGSEPEQVVAEQATHKYKTSIHPDEHPLYDLGEDKHKLIQEAKQANNGALDMDMVHNKIKQAGFSGFFNSKHPSLSHVVAMYHPLKVEHREQIR